MSNPRIAPGRPRRITQKSWPGPRRRRVSQPSIHLPFSSYLPAINTAASRVSMRSFGAKNSSLADTALAPMRGSARFTQRRTKSGASAFICLSVIDRSLPLLFSDQVVQAESGYASDLLQAGTDLLFRGMRKPLFQLGNDLRARQSPYRNDEREIELPAVVRIQGLQPGELFRRAAIQSGAGLLAARGVGQPAVQRKPPREFRMRANQRQLFFSAGDRNDFFHCRMQCIARAERPCRPRALRHPGRMLVDAAQLRDERVALHRIDLPDRNRHAGAGQA